jgi:hypothetical protein
LVRTTRWWNCPAPLSASSTVRRSWAAPQTGTIAAGDGVADATRVGEAGGETVVASGVGDGLDDGVGSGWGVEDELHAAVTRTARAPSIARFTAPTLRAQPSAAAAVQSMRRGQQPAMSKGGDNREQRAHIRQAAREGKGAGEAGVSTGAAQQIGHGDQQAQKDAMHEQKGKT